MNNDSSFLSTAAQGGLAATALLFIRQAITRMIPYAFVVIPLIILDLRWGVPAAKHRGEKVTISRAFRRTMSKTFDYICWIVISSTLAVAFERPWLEYVILGAVIFNEIVSIVGNYLEVTKGIELSWKEFYRWMFKRGAEKAGVEVTDEDASGIIRHKTDTQQRDSKGRFTKKSE